MWPQTQELGLCGGPSAAQSLPWLSGSPASARRGVVPEFVAPAGKGDSRDLNRLRANGLPGLFEKAGPEPQSLYQVARPLWV